MMNSALVFFESKQETGIPAVLIFLGMQRGHLRKRLKGTFRVTVKRQLRQVDESEKTSWKR